MTRTMLAVGGLALGAAACSPGPIAVPPKLGISHFDKDASGLSIHEKDDKDVFTGGTATVLRDDLVKAMNEGTGGGAGKPARFRVHVEHDFSLKAGTMVLGVVTLFLVPLITNMSSGECDDKATVDVQIGERFYHADVTTTTSYGFRDRRDKVCAHAVMEAALDALQPVPRPKPEVK